jgi:hypothetical protein
MGKHSPSARKLWWIRPAIVIGLLVGAFFLFRWYKNHAVERSAIEIITWVKRAVLAPNELEVYLAGGGGPNWAGLGEYTLFVETFSSDGTKVSFFFDMDSTVLDVRNVETLMVIRASPLDLRTYRAKEIADVMAAPKPGPIRIAAAKDLTKEEWIAIAASDPMGFIRVQIPAERLQSETPLMIRDAMPGFFRSSSPPNSLTTQPASAAIEGT